jgi:hypothetical protein
VGVDCFSLTGAPLDSTFIASFTAGGGARHHDHPLQDEGLDGGHVQVSAYGSGAALTATYFM